MESREPNADEQIEAKLADQQSQLQSGVQSQVSSRVAAHIRRQVDWLVNALRRMG